MPRKMIAIITLFLSITMSAGSAYAGFAGHNSKGDYGLQSASQPPPGFYLIAPMYYRYDGERLKNRDGDSVRIDLEGRGSLDMNAYILGFIFYNWRIC